MNSKEEIYEFVDKTRKGLKPCRDKSIISDDRSLITLSK